MRTWKKKQEFYSFLVITFDLVTCSSGGIQLASLAFLMLVRNWGVEDNQKSKHKTDVLLTESLNVWSAVGAFIIWKKEKTAHNTASWECVSFIPPLTSGVASQNLHTVSIPPSFQWPSSLTNTDEMQTLLWLDLPLWKRKVKIIFF